MSKELRNLEDIVLSYRNDGFAVVKNAIPHSLIDLLLKQTLQLASQKVTNELRDIHRVPNGEISSIHNLANYIPEYDAAINHPPIVEIFNAIHGPPSEFVFNSSYFAKPMQVGYETKAHQDNAFFCMRPAEVMTCWFPVEFADIRNGALYYYQGSWKERDIQHVPEGNLGASMCVDTSALGLVRASYPKLYVELSKGDCVLHNALVVHGSDPNNSTYDRKAFNFSIASKRAIRDEKLFELYQARLQAFLTARKLPA